MSAGVKLAGVIGWPVDQSLSPVLHGYWLREHRLGGFYVPLPIRPEDFARCAVTLPLMGFAGASVTVPHKQAAFALAATQDEDARLTGAVNTLVFQDGAVRGLNTDVQGFSASLSESFGVDAARQGPAVLLGAGGAARGIALALLRAGAPEIRLVNRTRSRAEQLAAAFAAKARIAVVDWRDWGKAFSNATLLVNATSLGMTGKEPLDLSLDQLAKEAGVADIVYHPLETALLRAARLGGHRTMDGLGMLMHQAVPAFEAWFGVRPSITPALRAELTKALTRA